MIKLWVVRTEIHCSVTRMLMLTRMLHAQHSAGNSKDASNANQLGDLLVPVNMLHA